MEITNKSEGFKIGYKSSVIEINNTLNKYKDSNDPDIQLYCKEIRQGYYQKYINKK